jgi:hypothetical protein
LSAVGYGLPAVGKRAHHVNRWRLEIALVAAPDATASITSIVVDTDAFAGPLEDAARILAART